MRRHRLRHRYGMAGVPFAGTNYIERRYYDLQPTLVSAAFAQLSREQTQDAVRRGRELLEWLEAQRAPKSARAFMSRVISDVRRTLAKAEAQL